MKPEEQRIAIAEACGWTEVDWNGVYQDWLGVPPNEERDRHPIPDYLNDLNAMHEAVETLRGKDGPQWFDFQRTLMIQCGSWMNCIQASAAQRAEAFLRTLNLWVD
jgi:hypothetical protein